MVGLRCEPGVDAQDVADRGKAGHVIVAFEGLLLHHGVVVGDPGPHDLNEGGHSAPNLP